MKKIIKNILRVLSILWLVAVIVHSVPQLFRINYSNEDSWGWAMGIVLGVLILGSPGIYSLYIFLKPHKAAALPIQQLSVTAVAPTVKKTEGSYAMAILLIAGFIGAIFVMVAFGPYILIAYFLFVMVLSLYQTFSKS